MRQLFGILPLSVTGRADYGMNQIEKKSFFVFDLLSVDCLLDLLHDGVDLGVAAGVDGLALLLASHAANVGGDVIEDGGEGDIDNVSLAESGGNGESVLIELVQGLGVQAADEELGALVDILLGLLEEDGVEVAGSLSLTLAVSVSATSATAEVESVTGGDVAGDGSLGSSVDEALADEDLGADDDGGGGQELGVDNGHGADEADGDDDGLHFAVS